MPKKRLLLAMAAAVTIASLAGTSAGPAAAAGVSIPGSYVGSVAFSIGSTAYSPLATSPYRGYTYGSYQGVRVSSGFGAPRPAHPHSGTDFAVPVGTPLYAPWSGRVVRVAYDSLFGNHVLLRGRNGRLALFAHLARPAVRSGQVVAAGSRIALSGNTGSSTGPHLHLTVWRGTDGHLANPLQWLQNTASPLFRR